jgi:hypothetical protein
VLPVLTGVVTVSVALDVGELPEAFEQVRL